MPFFIHTYHREWNEKKRKQKGLIGCNTGHTAPAMGTGYVGTGETHGFQPYTMVYHGVSIPWYTVGTVLIYHRCTHIYILFTKIT